MFTVLGAASASAQAPDETSPKDEPPFYVGQFELIYNPSVGESGPWYINDHCFIRDSDGTWHLYGITHSEPAAPRDEDHFAHATAKRLTQYPWHKQPFALSVDTTRGETHLWAPHVIEHDGIYYMYYAGGGEDNTRAQINLATSYDLEHWTRYPNNPLFVDGYDARDPFILHHGNQWIMYYTATTEPGGGNYIVAFRTSDDLKHWGERHVAYTDPKAGKKGGPTESPTVLQRGDAYYLFIGPRPEYVGTDVFRSDDPFHWDLEDKVGHVEAHALEVVRNEQGQWYVSRAGWGKGGVYLAPLFWNDGLNEAPTSLPVPE